MNFLDTVNSRQSVRAFDPDRPVAEETIRAIVEAGMNAPSALGQHAWRFVTVTNKETLHRHAELKNWWSMLNEATLGIGILIDPTAADGLDEEFLVISAALAAENMLLAAHSEGLGGVYLGASKSESYYPGLAELYNIPDHLRMIGMLAMGYPKEALAQPENRFDDTKWIRERF